MSKRARHQSGFYATLLNDVRHLGFNSKYRPKLKPIYNNMSKRASHQSGFYATLLNDVRHRGFNSKYRPRVKPYCYTKLNAL